MENTKLCACIFESDKYLFAKVSSTHAFGRVDVEGPFYYCDSDGRQCVRILHPNEVLADILKENQSLIMRQVHNSKTIWKTVLQIWR